MRRMVAFGCLGLIAFMMCACASDEKVATSSSVKNLPTFGSRVWVWSQEGVAAAVATQWISDRGLYPVQKPLPISLESLCKDTCDGHAVARALTTTKEADYVLLIRVANDGAPDRLMVRMNGISLSSSAEIFSGSGWEWMEESSHDEDKNRRLSNLVCKTLATMWRYRAAGFVEHESVDYCNLPRLRA